MAVPALQEAAESVFRFPSFPALGRIEGIPSLAAYRENLESKARAFDKSVLEWKTNTASARAKVDAVIADGSLQPKLLVIVLDGLIQRMDGTITEYDANLKTLREEHEAVASEMRSLSRDYARVTRRVMYKVFETADRIHNEMVDFYYFLMAVRANFDPDAHDGPGLSGAGEVGAYLRDKIKSWQ